MQLDNPFNFGIASDMKITVRIRRLYVITRPIQFTTIGNPGQNVLSVINVGQNESDELEYCL